VPRYRFKWENLPEWLQAELLEGTRCDSLKQLAKQWGARPGENLVHEHRQLLTSGWLGQDEASRRAVVKRLQDAQLGEDWRRPRSAKGELDYINSCRNTKGFQRAVLDVLIDLGEVDSNAPTESPADSEGRKAWRRVATDGDPPQFTPHPHQNEAWSELSNATPLTGGLLVLPTGAGKTVTAVRWILQHVLSEPRSRQVLWLAHRSELLDQAASTFAAHAALAERREPLSIRCISSAHGNRAHTMLQPADVVCATVASLQREPEVVAEYFARTPDAFVVIDEAHHAAAKSYQRLIAAARKSHRAEILGLTATPTRTIEGELGLLHNAVV